MSAHVYEPVLPPSRVVPEIPPDLERVVMQCLAKAPAERFRDADALEQALGACASAREWNADVAADWWRAHEPESLRPVTCAAARGETWSVSPEETAGDPGVRVKT
jgi:serine/threonine-protein kinase